MLRTVGLAAVRVNAVLLLPVVLACLVATESVVSLDVISIHGVLISDCADGSCLKTSTMLRYGGCAK